MGKTASEDLFELFCERSGITFYPIIEDGEPTPDYEIYPAGEKVIVEVKQIDPNPEEIEAMKKTSSEAHGTPGARVRSKITDASKQIRARAKGIHPSILVLYDNVPFRFHTDPYFVRAAMYGLETYVVSVPEDYEIQPYVKECKFGPKRKMTEDHNTSISALAVLRRDAATRPCLDIYHNVCASVPLDPELMRPFLVRQYTLEKQKSGSFQDWIEL